MIKSRESDVQKSGYDKEQADRAHNDSKAQRKHRIFDQNQKSSSLSPNNRLSPFTGPSIAQNNFANASKVVNPLQKPKV